MHTRRYVAPLQSSSTPLQLASSLAPVAALQVSDAWPPEHTMLPVEAQAPTPQVVAVTT